MFKGAYNIFLAFICILSVVVIGNKISTKLRLDMIGDSQVYHQYEEWERKQLKVHPDYDNLWILINIDSKKLRLVNLENNGIIKKYYVATGKPSTPTPIGNFKIIQKSRWGGGFGSRWMKLNVPWGNYGIHGTNKPNSIGYNASHGCIRMRNDDIEELYNLVKYNTPVTIEGGPYGPFNYGFRILRPGDRGADVREVESRLKEQGYYHGALDGIYGDSLKRAVIKFREDKKLPKEDKIDYMFYKKLGIILIE